MPNRISKQRITWKQDPDNQSKPANNVARPKCSKTKTKLILARYEYDQNTSPPRPLQNNDKATISLKFEVSQESGHHFIVAFRTVSIKPNNNVTANASREMDFGLKIKLDSNHERGILQLPIGANWAFEEISCRMIVSFEFHVLDLEWGALYQWDHLLHQRDQALGGWWQSCWP